MRHAQHLFCYLSNEPWYCCSLPVRVRRSALDSNHFRSLFRCLLVHFLCLCLSLSLSLSLSLVHKHTSSRHLGSQIVTIWHCRHNNNSHFSHSFALFFHVQVASFLTVKNWLISQSSGFLWGQLFSTFYHFFVVSSSSVRCFEAANERKHRNNNQNKVYANKNGCRKCLFHISILFYFAVTFHLRRTLLLFGATATWPNSDLNYHKQSKMAIVLFQLSSASPFSSPKNKT
jgi:hypothetical protein